MLAREAFVFLLRLREDFTQNPIHLVGVSARIGRINEVVPHARLADEREAHAERNAGDLGSHEDDVRFFHAEAEFVHDRGEIGIGCFVRYLDDGEDKPVVEDVLVVCLHAIDTEVDAVDLAVKRTTQFVGLLE